MPCDTTLETREGGGKKVKEKFFFFGLLYTPSHILLLKLRKRKGRGKKMMPGWFYSDLSVFACMSFSPPLLDVMQPLPTTLPISSFIIWTPPPKKNKKTKKKRNICWMCYIIRLSTRKNTFNSFTTDVTFLFVDKSWNKVIFKFMIFVVSWLEKICSGHFLFTIKQEIVCFLFFFLKKFSQHNIK